MISKKLIRKANRSRKMAANAMRNMQIPAYSPVVFGVNDDDQREVLVDTEKTIGIVIVIVVMSVDDVDIDMAELAVELAMAIEVVIELMSMEVAIELISILTI